MKNRAQQPLRPLVLPVHQPVSTFQRPEEASEMPPLALTTTLTADLEESRTRCKAMFGSAYAGVAGIGGKPSEMRLGEVTPNSRDELALSDSDDGYGLDNSPVALRSSAGLGLGGKSAGVLGNGSAGVRAGDDTSSDGHSESSESDWAMEQYRRERMEEIMRAGAGGTAGGGSVTPQSSSFAGHSDFGEALGEPLSGRKAAARESSSTPTANSPNHRRSSSSSFLNPTGNWATPMSGRLVLNTDQLELCKRLDQELKQYYTQFHYAPLEKQYIIRAVHCKKNFDRALKMCLELCTDVLDRYGLSQLKVSDVALVVERRAMLRVEPSICVCRNDGSSVFYVVAARLTHPSMVDPQELVRALLFTIERTRAFEGRLTYVVDLRDYQIKPGNVKFLTDLTETMRNALEGKYPAQVSRIILLPDPRSFGPVTSVLLKGIMMKALTSRWRDKVQVLKSLDDVVSNPAGLRRALYDQLGY